MRTLSYIAVVTLALALGGVTAVAQPKPAPPPPAMEQSRALYVKATESYRLGKFDDALADYQAAYGLYAAPQFLFNIAQCHFQLQQWDRAIFFFEGYLRELPDAGNRDLVDDLIAEARARRAEEIAAEQKRLELERARVDAERAAEERAAAERARLAVSTRTPPPPPAKPVYTRWWFWTAVGVAATGVAVTAAVAGGETHTVLPAGSLGTWDRR